jgi:hypothetical protein
VINRPLSTRIGVVLCWMLHLDWCENSAGDGSIFMASGWPGKGGTLRRISLPCTPVNKPFSDAAVFGWCHYAEYERWLVSVEEGAFLAERIDPDIVCRIRDMAAQLAKREYPRVWIGEPGITPEQLLADQNFDEEARRDAWEKMTRQERKEILEETPEDLREHISDEILMQPPQKWEDLPQQLRERLRDGLEVDPGEFVEIWGTGMGLEMPKVSYEYLDGLWVLENMRYELHESVEAELHQEVLYIFAAKQGKVPVIVDSRERHEAGIAPDISLTSIDDLTPQDLGNIRLEEMKFYIEDPEAMGPDVLEDSGRARRALDERLES